MNHFKQTCGIVKLFSLYTTKTFKCMQVCSQFTLAHWYSVLYEVWKLWWSL